MSCVFHRTLKETGIEPKLIVKYVHDVLATVKSGEIVQNKIHLRIRVTSEQKIYIKVVRNRHIAKSILFKKEPNIDMILKYKSHHRWRYKFNVARNLM